MTCDELLGLSCSAFLPWLIFIEGTGVSVPYAEVFASAFGAGIGWTWNGREES